jgi:hypothetical protein
MELEAAIAVAGLVPALVSTIMSVGRLRSAQDADISTVEIHKTSGAVFRARLDDQREIEQLTDLLLAEHEHRVTAR